MPSEITVSGLTVSYDGGTDGVPAVREVSVQANSSERIGIVGESGSGKSTLATTLLGALPGNARVRFRQATWGGAPIFGSGTSLAGRRIGFVAQNPLQALDPLMSVRGHFKETLATHRPDRVPDLSEVAATLLDDLELRPARELLKKYPFELSGGMRQRLMLALALAAEPEMLILDEPTTALDTVTQKRLIEVVQRLVEERQLGLWFITHDLALLATVTDRLLVMYSGVIVEEGRTARVFREPHHPYTAALVECMQQGGDAKARFATIPNAEFVPPPRLCVFLGRCTRAIDRCYVDTPEETPTSDGMSRCHLASLESGEKH